MRKLKRDGSLVLISWRSRAIEHQLRLVRSRAPCSELQIVADVGHQLRLVRSRASVAISAIVADSKHQLLGIHHIIIITGRGGCCGGRANRRRMFMARPAARSVSRAVAERGSGG